MQVGDKVKAYRDITGKDLYNSQHSNVSYIKKGSEWTISKIFEDGTGHFDIVVQGDDNNYRTWAVNSEWFVPVKAGVEFNLTINAANVDEVVSLLLRTVRTLEDGPSAGYLNLTTADFKIKWDLDDDTNNY